MQSTAFVRPLAAAAAATLLTAMGAAVPAAAGGAGEDEHRGNGAEATVKAEASLQAGKKHGDDEENAAAGTAPGTEVVVPPVTPEQPAPPVIQPVAPAPVAQPAPVALPGPEVAGVSAEVPTVPSAATLPATGAENHTLGLAAGLGLTFLGLVLLTRRRPKRRPKHRPERGRREAIGADGG